MSDREQRHIDRERVDRMASSADEDFRQRVQQAELELTRMHEQVGSGYEKNQKDRGERDDRDEHEQVSRDHVVEVAEEHPGDAVDQLLRAWTTINISGVEVAGH